jgi:putative metallohydrolase (TIGR04338 family)
VIDRDRAAVYAAEDQWNTILDRGGRVDFFGSTLQIAPQLRFADQASVERYVDAALARMAFTGPPVEIRQRKGGTRAHYSDGVIAIPIQHLWSGRESVVLHELAHHISAGFEPAHGSMYRANMITLVRTVQSAESALILSTAYREAGLT